MNILSISSQVAYGHVGNSAAVFALERLGHEVWPLPTVLYSNHPGHGDFEGEAVAAGLLEKLLAGLARRGALGTCDGVLTGYLRDPDQARLARRAVDQVKAANRRALYCCDPVMGDRHTGLYVAQAVADEIAGPLLGAADLVTPNGFELELLAGAAVTTLDQARAAAEGLLARGPRLVVCTSPVAPTDTLATLAVSAEGAWAVRTPALSPVPHGAGDLFAALFLGHYLRGGDVAASLAHAVSACFGVLRASVAQGSDELALIAAQDEIVAPSRRFEASKLD